MTSRAARPIKKHPASDLALPMTISEGQLAVFRNPHEYTGSVVGRGANQRNWKEYLERIRQLNDALCQG